MSTPGQGRTGHLDNALRRLTAGGGAAPPPQVLGSYLSTELA